MLRGNTEVFNEKLGVKNVKIERAHCSKRSKVTTIVKNQEQYYVSSELQIKGRNTNKHKKKLKVSNIFINEKFCHETMQYRKKL